MSISEIISALVQAQVTMSDLLMILEDSGQENTPAYSLINEANRSLWEGTRVWGLSAGVDTFGSAPTADK